MTLVSDWDNLTTDWMAFPSNEAPLPPSLTRSGIFAASKLECNAVWKLREVSDPDPPTAGGGGAPGAKARAVTGAGAGADEVLSNAHWVEEPSLLWENGFGVAVGYGGSNFFHFLSDFHFSLWYGCSDCPHIY